MKNWKYIVIVVFGLIVNYLFVRWNKSKVSDRNRIKIELEKLRANKDSIFSMADNIADSIDRKDSLNKYKIEQLQNILEEQQKALKTNKPIIKIVEVEKKTEDGQENLMASGVDVKTMEQELARKQQIIDILTNSNRRLVKENDSLIELIEKK